MKKLLAIVGLLLSQAVAAAITVVGVGSGATGVDGADLVPSLYASTAAGDFILCSAAQKSGSGATNISASGYTRIYEDNSSRADLAYLAKIATAGEGSPTVVFADNTAGRSTNAQCFTLRGVDSTLGSVVVHSARTDNAATQSITTPAMTVTTDNTVVVVVGFKESSFNGDTVNPLSGHTKIAQNERTSSQTNGLMWGYQIQTTAANLSASTYASPSSGAQEGVSLAISLKPAASGPPAGYQDTVLASVGSQTGNPCAVLNATISPTIAAGDTVRFATTTSGGAAVTVDTDCSIRYNDPSSSRQTVALATVLDASAGNAAMSGGPTTVYLNYAAPACTTNDCVYDTESGTSLIDGVAMTSFDLANLCSDPDGNAITVTTSDTGTGTGADKRPAGTTITSGVWAGTPTSTGVTTGYWTTTCTGISGDATTVTTYWTVYDQVTVPTCTGGTLNACLSAAANVYLSPSFTSDCDAGVAAGNVISQSPAAASSANPFTSLFFVVSTGSCGVSKRRAAVLAPPRIRVR